MDERNLSTCEVDDFFKTIETTTKTLFGPLVLRSCVNSMSMTLTVEKDQFDFAYVPQDVGAASLHGTVNIALWTPSDLEFVPQLHDPEINREIGVYTDLCRNPDADEPEYLYINRYSYYFDLFSRGFSKQSALLQCAYAETDLYDVYGEIAFGYTDDGEEDLILRDLEERAGNDTDHITTLDRERVLNAFHSIGLATINTEM